MPAKPATPLPQLRVYPDPRGTNKLFCIGTMEEIPYTYAVVHGSLGATREQRAQQIVAACNALPELVEALRNLLDTESWDAEEKARALLAKLEGK